MSAEDPRWPTPEELLSADRRVHSGTDALGELSFLFADVHEKYMGGDGKPPPLSIEEYGRIALYFESIELSLGSATDTLERMRSRLDDVCWEVVDLESPRVDA